MSSLENQIDVLQRRAAREKKARKLAEEQLENYSRRIYQTNLSLAHSLDVAEWRQQELEFLNEMAKQIVLDNSPEVLLNNILPLLGLFVEASLGMAFPSTSEKILPSSTKPWGLDSQSDLFVQQCADIATFLSEQSMPDNNQWQLVQSDLLQTNQASSALLLININTRNVDGYLICFDLVKTELTVGFFSTLNTARDLLISGLRRRQYEAKIIKRNEQLQESIADLERVQTQLIHSEKMASLGQLAAGVAHEINNPIGFIKANSEMLAEYVRDLENCTQMLRTRSQEKALSGDNVSSIFAQFDIDYIIPDMFDILEANSDGVSRIKTIVSGLGSFSHPGEQKKIPICLASCIRLSLKLVANELKYKHVVDNQLPEELPMIVANQGQLQQVFVILIINAVHAMPDGGTLTFSHSIDVGSVTLTIADTGCGIRPEDLNQIFTPFFTTKPVGSGTGLGLSITHAILEGHEATVNVESEVGKGTRFHLTFNTID